MDLAEGRLEQIFGERSAGRFADSWPGGKSLAILLSFDMQEDVDAAAAYAIAHQGVWITTANEVASHA